MHQRNMIDVGVNGLGRIGVPFTWQAIRDEEINLRVVGSRSISPAHAAEQIAFDSVHGRFDRPIKAVDDHSLYADGELLPTVDTQVIQPGVWASFSDRLLLADCTGYYTTMEKARVHIDTGGAAAVILSSPAKDPSVLTVVRGVSDSKEMLEQAAEQKVVAVSSCSTNCIAPILRVFDDRFSLDRASAVIVHARTSSQPHLDGRGDTTASRRSADNTVESSTGSSKEVVRLLPGVIFEADCFRVPVADGSVARMTLELSGRVTEQDVVALLATEIPEDPRVQDVIGTEQHDMFSRAVIGTSYSSVVDLNTLEVIPRHGDTTVRLSAWFDNEWGYTNRVRDVVKMLGRQLLEA